MSEKTRHRAASEALRDSPVIAKQTPSQEPLRLYEFGPFRLDPVERRLLRENDIVPITPKAFDTLYLLVRNSGHLLEKDEMIRALWPDTFVEEGSLSNNVFLLRKALGEDPAFIETVPRRGYRFVGAVLQLPHAAPAQLQEAPPGPELARFHIPKPLQLFVGVALAVLIAVFSLLLSHRSQQVSEPTILPAISLPGDQSMPALSADGSRLAFVWNPPQRNESGIFVAVLGTQGLVRITKNERDCTPAWSPDGSYLGFLRFEGSQFSVMIVPALGGHEKTVFSVTHTRLAIETPTSDYHSRLTASCWRSLSGILNSRVQLPLCRYRI